MKIAIQVLGILAISACTASSPERAVLKQSESGPKAVPCFKGEYPTQNTVDDVKERREASNIIQERLGFTQKPLPENLTNPVPLMNPAPSTPYCAMVNRVIGTCYVLFDISKTGEPMNVTAVCNHVMFQRESERSVEKVRFSPATVNGEPVEYLSMVYPLDFSENGTPHDVELEW